MRRAIVAPFLAGALVVAIAAPAAAQGFGVNEHGTCTMGRAGAAVASPCQDGSGIFFNPAGITGTPGFLITVGTTLIAAGGGFTNDTTGLRTELDNDPVPVPHLYLQYGVNDRLALGLGVFVPYGLGTRWPTTFEGRFSGFDNDLRSIYIQPTAAFEVIKGLKIGAGLDVAIGSIELNQRIDLFEQLAPAPAPPGTILGQLGIQRGTDVASAFVEATGATGIGGNFGIIYSPVKQVSFGVRYLTKVTLDYAGTAEFTQVETGITLPDGTAFGVSGPLPLDAVVTPSFGPGGPFAPQTVTATITMPAQIVAGVAVRPTDDLMILADYQQVRWATFDSLIADFENGAQLALAEDYENTHAFRVGVEWSPSETGTFRAGYLYHTAAAPPQTVTPLLPEGKRNEFTVGYGRRLTGAFRFDAAYQYLRQQDRRGRMRGPLPGETVTTALNAGLYEFSANLFGLSLTFMF